MPWMRMKMIGLWVPLLLHPRTGTKRELQCRQDRLQKCTELERISPSILLQTMMKQVTIVCHPERTEVMPTKMAKTRSHWIQWKMRSKMLLAEFSNLTRKRSLLLGLKSRLTKKQIFCDCSSMRRSSSSCNSKRAQSLTTIDQQFQTMIRTTKIITKITTTKATWWSLKTGLKLTSKDKI